QPSSLYLSVIPSHIGALQKAWHCSRSIRFTIVGTSPSCPMMILICLRVSPITRYPTGPVTGVLAKPCARLNATSGQVLFLWVRAKGAVVVTTTSKEERLREYLGIGDLAEEINLIDSAAEAGFNDSTSQEQAPSTQNKEQSSIFEFKLALL
ncbi:13354_t:CDS:2, partial [Acaulospora colombiana]